MMSGALGLTTLLGCITLSSGLWYALDDKIPIPRNLELDGGAAVQLPFDLVLFGRSYSKGTYIWISSNGYLSIDSNVTEFEFNTYPLGSTNMDPVLISPFKARMKYRPRKDQDMLASVSYSFNIPTNVKSDVATRISDISSKGRNFKISGGLAVCWESISFDSGNPNFKPYPRNTFQLLLVTDGKQTTYAIFNYKAIVWDGGYASGGSAETGVGAVTPPAQAGFNLGKSRGFISLPDNGSILQLDDITVSNDRGSFLYEVSAATPISQGCVTSSKDLESVSIYPTSGPMYGGNVVMISGYCFSPAQLIECQFDNTTVDGYYISVSLAFCYAPTFYGNVKVKFGLLIDNVTVNHQEILYFASSHVSNRLDLVNVDNWRSTSPSENLELRWDPTDVYFKGQTAKLKLKLMTYFENSMNPDDFGWREELILDDNVPNTGSYSFSSSQFKCTSNCKEKTTGAVLLEIADSSESSSPGRLWADVGPLGWYVADNLQSNMGDLWPDQMCYEWYKEDIGENKTGLMWLDDLVSCPCTIQQAMVDIGRFVPDPGCNIYTNNSYSCWYHPQAIHCVRSIWPSVPVGAGVQCCYSAQNDLIYAGDSTSGSTVDKGHSLGAAPYYRVGHIPGLSHWLYDVTTYQYCCLWNSLNDTCGIYMDQRPTKDCNEYTSVIVAGVFGDPHVQMFDSQTYSVNSPGDFTLLKIAGAANLNVQARFLRTSSGADATIVSTIVVREDNSQDLMISLNDHGSIKKTTVEVDGKEQSFDDTDWFMQEFNGFKILSQRPLVDQSNFTVTYQSGMGIRVTASYNKLDVIITVPSNVKKNGDWTGLTGLLVDKDVGKARLTTSLFKKPYTDTEASQIVLQPDNYNSDTEQVLCGSNSPCIFDYKTTGNKDLAAETRLSSDWLKTMYSYSGAVTSCGMPVFHALRNGSKYTPGNTVSITGCRHGYKLSQDVIGTYTCMKNGLWNSDVNLTCIFEGFSEFQEIITPAPIVHGESVALPVMLALLAVLLAVVLVGIVMYLRQKRKRSQSDKPDSTKSLDTSNEAYILSSNGSMTVNPKVAEQFFQTQELEGFQHPDVPAIRANTYREAVDPYNVSYMDDEDSNYSTNSTDRYPSPNSANRNFHPENNRDGTYTRYGEPY